MTATEGVGAGGASPSGGVFSLPFEALEAGTRFASRGRTVTEADVVAFGTLTGDLHPQHTDAEWAARSAFGERIAHGMLVLAYAAGLVGFDPARVVALRRVRDAVFKRPVRLGDTIRVHGRLAELRPLDDRVGLVAVALDVRGAQARTVMRATVEVLWATDAAPADADAPEAGAPR